MIENIYSDRWWHGGWLGWRLARWGTVRVSIHGNRNWEEAQVLGGIQPNRLGLVIDRRRRAKDREKSRMPVRFLVWIAGCVGVPFTEAENREVSPLSHGCLPLPTAMPCGCTVDAQKCWTFIQFYSVRRERRRSNLFFVSCLSLQKIIFCSGKDLSISFLASLLILLYDPFLCCYDLVLHFSVSGCRFWTHYSYPACLSCSALSLWSLSIHMI